MSVQKDVDMFDESASFLPNASANDTSTNTSMRLCESLWVNITSFLTYVDIDNIKPISLRQHSSATEEREEQSLRCTCKDLHQLLTSEEYYQAKVVETFGCNFGDASDAVGKWPSAESVGGWRALYNDVLSTYAPLEGWCTICEAWPWGLLVRCRFEEGCFRGDLIRVFQGTDPSDPSYRTTVSDRVFEISFGKGGEARCRMFDRSDFANEFRICFQPVLFEGHSTVFPRKMGGFTLQIIWHVQDDGGAGQRRSPQQIHSLPFMFNRGGGPATGAELVEGLRNKSLVQPLDGLHRIRFEFLGLLSKTSTLAQGLSQASTTMPSLKPGLYIGNYGNGEIYGQFKHDIVHVSYVDVKNSNALQATFGKRIPDNVDRFKESVLVVARKITGDMHVPAGEISWFADVSKQSSGDLPKHIQDREGNRCRVANSWSGFGTLAKQFFKWPTWHKGWLLQLHDGRFAFCWAMFSSQDVTVLYEVPNL